MPRRGFALVTVLWIVLLLGMFAAGISEVARRSARSAVLLDQAAQAQALIDLAIARAVWAIKRQDGALGVLPNGLINTDAVGTGQIALRITPADSLIDLNATTAALFDRLSVMPGVDATDRFSAALQAQAGRMGAVQDLARVGQELNTPRDVIQGLTQVTTVYSGNTAPDLTNAPREVLTLVPGLSDTIIDQILQARREGRALSPQIPEIWVPQPGSIRPIGPVYHIEAAGRTRGGLRRGRVVVVFLPLPETRPILPYYILESWDIPSENPLFDALSEPE